ncbi:MAG: hypothetical protein KDD78_04785 [Caldilineaceae bacterium]|nr:hypothetical protein [Caldilineaceae bacterium]
MQTYSHLILTGVLDRELKRQETSRGGTPEVRVSAADTLPPVNTGALLLGSVAPDLPLIFLFFVNLARDILAGNRLAPGDETAELASHVGWLFRVGFYQDPWIIAAHNLFHAPILTVTYTVTGYWLWTKKKRGGAALFWFGLACTLHTLIDIPLHYDDGPLLLFPLNWTLRFYSPLSYWDPARGGIWFTIFEHTLVLASSGYLIWDWVKRRRQRAADVRAGTD